MRIDSFKDMYLAELQELLSVEVQLADMLLRMAGAAAHTSLKRALIHHRAETETQALRVITVLKKHGADEIAHIDQAMEALIAETMKMMLMLKGDELRDAGLLASARRSSITRLQPMARLRRSPDSSTCATSRKCCI